MRLVHHDVAVGDKLRLVQLLGLCHGEALRLAKGGCSVVPGVGVEVYAREDVLPGLGSGARSLARPNQHSSLVNQRGVGLRPGDLLGRGEARTVKKFDLVVAQDAFASRAKERGRAKQIVQQLLSRNARPDAL